MFDVLIESLLVVLNRNLISFISCCIKCMGASVCMVCCPPIDTSTHTCIKRRRLCVILSKFLTLLNDLINHVSSTLKIEEGDVSKSSSSIRSKKPITKKVMEYCYEPEMEEVILFSLSSMLKIISDECIIV